MKRILFALFASLAVSVNAATWTKLGGVQIVDVAGLTESAMKLGEISGNTMLGAMLAAKIAEMPGNEFFGAMRQGGSLYLPFYVDSDKLAEADDATDVGDAIEFAVVYPMAITKEEFLKQHPGATETNGFVKVFGDIFSPKENWDEEDIIYVVFSEDGKWAAASDSQAQAVAAAADFPLSGRPMAGDVIRIEVLPRGIAELRKAADDEDVKKILESFDSCRFAIRIGDAGIDLHGAIRTVEGSVLSKAGDVALPEDPFAFDDGTAFAAIADSFTDQTGSAQLVNKALDILKDAGCDASRFIACSETNDVCRISVDIKEFAKYSSNPSNRLDNVNFDDVCEKIGNLDDGADKFKLSTKPYGVAISAVGQKPRFSASQRFANVLPEVKGKRMFYAGTYSLSALVQAIIEAATSAMDDKTRAESALLVAMLPKECLGGIACAYWREEGEINMLGRFSADEIRNIVTGVSSVAMYAMMRGCDDCDGEDCLDEDAGYEEDFDCDED